MERDLQRKLKNKKRASAPSPGAVSTMPDISQRAYETEQQPQQHQLPDLNPHDILQQQSSAQLLDVSSPNEGTSSVVKDFKDSSGAEPGTDTSLDIPDAGNAPTMSV